MGLQRLVVSYASEHFFPWPRDLILIGVLSGITCTFNTTLVKLMCCYCKTKMICFYKMSGHSFVRVLLQECKTVHCRKQALRRRHRMRCDNQISSFVLCKGKALHFYKIHYDYSSTPLRYCGSTTPTLLATPKW